MIDLKLSLKKSGFFRTQREQIPVDFQGAPLPWYCYSSIYFLEPRLKKDFKVFEYGAGNSSLWYGERVEKVVSVESNKKFALVTAEQAGPNITIIFECETERYINAILQSKNKFDIIVVDGPHKTASRFECVKIALSCLKDSGVIVLDNSNGILQKPIFPYLKELNFKYLDFYGLGPQSLIFWGTTIFYRDGNCLGI